MVHQQLGMRNAVKPTSEQRISDIFKASWVKSAWRSIIITYQVWLFAKIQIPSEIGGMCCQKTKLVAR